MDLKEFLQLEFDKTSFIQFASERFYGFEENLNEHLSVQIALFGNEETMYAFSNSIPEQAKLQQLRSTNATN